MRERNLTKTFSTISERDQWHEKNKSTEICNYRICEDNELQVVYDEAYDSYALVNGGRESGRLNFSNKQDYH
jgi:hypothetical protein